MKRKSLMKKRNLKRLMMMTMTHMIKKENPKMQARRSMKMSLSKEAWEE